MTWQAGLTVVGYAVGTYFGYPQLGALVGSLVGAEVDRSQLPDSTTSGPRLTDLKAQISTYGADIPYLFGTNRVAGNVIWSADIEEVQTDTTTSAGGKGSGPTQTSITFSYFGTFAVLLSFGPCRGIRRIWGDQVLIYDGALDPPVGNVDYVFYQGTEDQMPDPTMEAALGVGNVPGYRGYCYVVFNRLPLDKFGNRIPNITVELTADGEFKSDGTALGPNPYVGSGVDYGHLIMGGAQRSDGAVIVLTYPNCTSPSPATGIRLALVDQFTGLTLLTVDHASIEGSNEVIDQNLMCYVPPSNEVWVSGTGALIYRFDASTFAQVGTTTLFAGAAKLAYEPTTRRVYFRPNASWICAGGEFVVLGAGTFNIDVLRLHFPDTSGPFITDCGSIGLDGTVNYESMSAIIASVPLVFLTDGAAQSHRACFDPTRRRYVAVDARIWTITDSETPVIAEHDPPVSLASSFETAMYDSATDSIILQSEVVGIVHVTILDAGTFALLYQGAVAGDGTLGINYAFPSSAGSLLELGSYQTWRLDYFGTTVGAAVARLCEASGMDSGEFNVSELGIPLRGYLMSSLSPARGTIEQLSTAFLFEGTEQDDILYFRRRGSAPVATITADECGAAVDAASEFPISRDRAQEADLPARLFVAAPDPYTDYQPGSQYGERRAIAAGDDEQVQLATVLTATESKRLADALIFDRWAGRNSRKWTTARKYARIVPADVVTLDGERVRVLRRSDDGPVIHWEGVTDDADVISQLGEGVQGSFPGQVVPIVVPSEMILLDAALLRDADNSAGAYIAAYGVPPFYRGTLVYSSFDGGSTWVRQATIPRPGSSVGLALNALADWTGGDVFDEASSLNVSMRNGTLSSTTRDGVLAGNNALALNGPNGWEVLQYRDVTVETDGSFTLRGLLRGRRGTEWATAGHDVGDTAVVLDATEIRNLPIINSQIGVALPYKAVSVGDSIASTAPLTETIAAERLKPWSPVDLRAHQVVGSSDVTFSWKRRTRLACRFTGTGGINVPLGEASELYDVEVLDPSIDIAVRTISGLTSPEFVYTAAERTADGYDVGASVRLRIYQISDIVGRGHMLQASAGFGSLGSGYAGGVPAGPIVYNPMGSGDGPEFGGPLLWDGAQFIAPNLFDRIVTDTGPFWVSTDGLNYTQLASSDLIMRPDILFKASSGTYFAAMIGIPGSGAHKAARSTDLMAWTDITFALVPSLAFESGDIVNKFLETPSGDLLVFFFNGEIQKSTDDGATWTRMCNVTAPNDDLYDLGFWDGNGPLQLDLTVSPGGVYVASGYSPASAPSDFGWIYVASSEAGPFTKYTAVAGIDFARKGFYVKWIDGHFYGYGAQTPYHPIVGDSYFISTGFIMRSTDGLHWTDVTPPITAFLTASGRRYLATEFLPVLEQLDDGSFFCLGANITYTSTDGETWVEQDVAVASENSTGNSLGAASSGTIVAAHIWLSTYDAATNSITFNHKPVASPDAITWTPDLDSAYVP